MQKKIDVLVQWKIRVEQEIEMNKYILLKFLKFKYLMYFLVNVNLNIF